MISWYLPQHAYSLIVSDSNVDDACLSVELFLESYWAATRSIILTETLQAPRQQRLLLTKQTTIDASIHSDVIGQEL